MHGKQYNTGLLIGRAFSFANDGAPDGELDGAVEELDGLANGDRLAIVLAMARFREFVNGPAPTDVDERALHLLQRTLRRFDTRSAARPPRGADQPARDNVPGRHT